MLKFGRFLLWCEIGWFILFLVTYSVALSETTTPLFPQGGDDVRGDVFATRTHVAVFSTILAFAKGRFELWVLPLLLFGLSADIFNLLELAVYSKVTRSTLLYTLGLVTGGTSALIQLVVIGWLLAKTNPLAKGLQKQPQFHKI